ncbi:KTSC domain-containing protein [Bradyrhizobium sp. 190]|uniref:KTSC domain-containing protein n=1 Tax=Bradyrhizobium sp. 190 TaxID=2782658 RepID=UPI001FFA5FD3|nr:KTSC domain-containing protein [Bradyrhizobium sp. 190]MCK1518229.1 KTSC domain-containing protein [Bradyrhizobium sp. 190]
MIRLAFILALLFTAPWEEAEIVDVKDRGAVDLKPFNCLDTTRSSVISRVCYDADDRRMLVQRYAAYHQYCDVPKDTLDAFLNAPSMGQYFNANIKGAGRNESGPYDCRTHKVSSYQ